MTAYGEVPNALLDVREAASHPWMGLTALLNKQPYLVIGKEGNKFILEGEAGDIQKLLQFEWKDATENSRLVAASRQEGSALTKGSVLGGYIVGGVRHHEGEWYVMNESGEDVLPFHSILSRIESHRNDPLALAWEIREAAGRKMGYGSPGYRCPECKSHDIGFDKYEDDAICQDCGFSGPIDHFLDEPPDFGGNADRLDWYPHWQDREAKTAGDIETVVTSTFENGGGTFDPISLDPFSPSSGFFASKKGFSVAEDKFSPELLTNALQTMELTSGEYLGTWVEEGRVYIDPARWFEDEDTASRFATQNGQTAIWDVAQEKVIYVIDRVSSKYSAWSQRYTPSEWWAKFTADRDWAEYQRVREQEDNPIVKHRPSDINEYYQWKDQGGTSNFEMKLPPAGIHFRTDEAFRQAGITCVAHLPAIPAYPNGLVVRMPGRDSISAMDYADEVEDSGGRLEDVTIQVDAPDGQEDEVRRIINEQGGATQQEIRPDDPDRGDSGLIGQGEY